ncbi:MAG: dephospho-CoA kinase [Ruminococcaceae bacterium]|nr:dephospho-CoA kinase [Oscillospiraceae bacterium]
MKVIGLTGQTGAGKGAFCKVLEKYGIPFLDTDKTAREVVGKGSPCLLELCRHFGNGILNDDGTLNRKALGNIAFSDKNELEVLNSITHKYITQRINLWLSVQKKLGFCAAVIDAPQLFESGAVNMCDVTVALIADEKTRLSRIIDRDGIDEEYAKKRMASQNDESFFIEKCDYVIYNNGSEKELEEETVAFLKKNILHFTEDK